MSSKSIMAVLAGTVVLFIVGFLLFGLALDSFYGEITGTATGVNKDSPEWLWLILSTVGWAAVLTLVLNWAGAKDPASGFKAAALFALLLGFALNFGFYSMTNLQSLTFTLIDPFVSAVFIGIGGAAIGFMLGRDQSA